MTASRPRVKRKPLLPRRSTSAGQIVASLSIGIWWVFLASSVWGPIYWASLAVWAALGFLLLPLRVAIPSRRDAVGPVIGFAGWLVPLGIVYALTIATGGNSSPFLPVGIATGGTLFGVAINLTVLGLPQRRAGYCPSCGCIRGLSKDFDRWYCESCGTEIRDGPVIQSSAGGRATVARNTTKVTYARKVPRLPDRESQTAESEHRPP